MTDDILFISSFHPYAHGEIGAGEAICGDNLYRFIDKGYKVDVFVVAPLYQRANPEVIKCCNSYIQHD